MLFIKEANAEKFLSDPFFIINICYRIHLKGCMLIWETLYYYYRTPQPWQFIELAWPHFWIWNSVSQTTLYFYNNEPSKNKHFLILLSSLARNSQEPNTKRIFEILWVLFERISVFYSYLLKSWIWRNLEQVRNIFWTCHLHNASHKSFGKIFFWIPCRGSKVPFWQFFNSGKMSLLNSCMEFNFSLTKRLLLTS